MKHLSTLIVLFFVMTSLNQSEAQTVLSTNASYPGICDGSADFSDYAGFSSNWSWNWYHDSTLISTGTNSIGNLCTGNYSLVLDSMGVQLTESFTISDPCSNIVVTPQVTNCTPGNCDGVIQILITGGNAPYTFAFDGSPQSAVSTISNLCPGTHSIVCMDMLGCTTPSISAMVTDPSAGPIIPNLTTINTTGSCNGYASVSPTGGSGSYTYLWNTGATSSDLTMLCAGSYTVTIYDGIDTVTVNAYIFDACSGFIGSVTTTPASGPGICDGTATFMAYGGTAPYSYSWNNGGNTSTVTNLCNGVFTVYCTDAMGCIATTPVVVSNSPCSSFSGTFTSTPTSGPAVCDGSITFNPSSGTAPFTFVWNTGSTTQSNSNLCAGTYSVTCTDANGCSTNGTGTITDSLCVISTYGALVNNCSPNTCDGSIDFSANSGAASYTYTWSNGATSALISNLCPGNYTVYCEDANGCNISASYSVTENVVSSLTANLNSVDDYTSNCTGSAFVSPSGGTAPYAIIWSTGETSTFIDSLCAGIYSVTILDAANDSTTVDFIITDSSTTYGNNPYPNATPSDTLYNYLVTNCVIDYSSIDSASLYQAVYDSISQNLYVTWAIYTPTDTTYLYDTLGFAGNPGYYNLTISVFCPNKSGNDFFKIEQVIYFDGSAVYFSTLGIEENALDHVSVYPNPFTHSILADNHDGIIQAMKLVDLNGRVLGEMRNLSSGVVEMNQLESLSSGTYLLILSGENSSKTYKVTK